MANRPTSIQIRERAERRCAELGITKPEPGSLSYKAKLAIWQERFDRQLADAEVALTRAHELEQQREDETAALERQRLDAQVDQLRTNYLAQPGTSEADFQQALPRLLDRQREDAALAGDTERQRQIAAARPTGRYSL